MLGSIWAYIFYILYCVLGVALPPTTAKHDTWAVGGHEENRDKVLLDRVLRDYRRAQRPHMETIARGWRCERGMQEAAGGGYVYICIFTKFPYLSPPRFPFLMYASKNPSASPRHRSPRPGTDGRRWMMILTLLSATHPFPLHATATTTTDVYHTPSRHQHPATFSPSSSILYFSSRLFRFNVSIMRYSSSPPHTLPATAHTRTRSPLHRGYTVVSARSYTYYIYNTICVRLCGGFYMEISNLSFH